MVNGLYSELSASSLCETLSGPSLDAPASTTRCDDDGSPPHLPSRASAELLLRACLRSRTDVHLSPHI